MSEDGNGQTSDPLGLDRGGEDTSPRPTVAVTEQEQKLRDSLVAAEQDLRRILHTSPVGISVSTVRDGRVVDMNDEFLHILGFDREQVIGRTSAELRLWTAAGQRESIVSEFRERGTCPPRPVTMRRRDGSLVTVLFSASALATGEEPHAIAWVMDITDRLRAEEELRASEEKWRTLVASAPVIILTIDRYGERSSPQPLARRAPAERDTSAGVSTTSSVRRSGNGSVRSPSSRGSSASGVPLSSRSTPRPRSAAACWIRVGFAPLLGGRRRPTA